LKVSRYNVLVALLLFAVTIEAVSAIEWAVYPYFPDKGLKFVRVNAAIFAVLAPFSPTLLILLLYIWPVRLAISLDNKFSMRLKSYFNYLTRPLLRLVPPGSLGSTAGLAMTRHPRFLLLLAVASASLVGLIPYRSTLNPSMLPVGVDAHFYIDYVNQMLERSPSAAISYAMGFAWDGSRPLLLVPMYLIATTGLVSVTQTFEALPAILGPVLALSTFIFVREGYKNEKFAGVASLFSVLSFNTTVGMWAGFYANWLALSETYLFLTVFLEFSRTASASRFTMLTLLSVAILLTHPWTWAIVLAVTTLFVLTALREERNVMLAKALVVLLAFNIFLDFAKSQIFGGRIVSQDSAAILSGAGLLSSSGLWQNVITTLFVFYDGLLGNAILLGLPLITMLVLKFRNRFERLLTLWVALGSIPFLVVTSPLQTRILYDMPLPTMTALAMLLLTRHMGNRAALSNLLLLLVLLFSANYVLSAVTNLVAVPF
jgi:hypothetical protein